LTYVLTRFVDLGLVGLGAERFLPRGPAASKAAGAEVVTDVAARTAQLTSEISGTGNGVIVGSGEALRQLLPETDFQPMLSMYLSIQR